MIVAPEPSLSMRAARLFLHLKANGVACGYTTICDKFSRPRYVRSMGVGYSSDVMLIGDDVKDRDCIIVDDMIDTVSAPLTEMKGTRTLGAVELIKKRGALKVYVAVTHGLFSGNSQKTIDRTPVEEVVIMNTTGVVPVRGEHT